MCKSKLQKLISLQRFLPRILFISLFLKIHCLPHSPYGALNWYTLVLFKIQVRPSLLCWRENSKVYLIMLLNGFQKNPRTKNNNPHLMNKLLELLLDRSLESKYQSEKREREREFCFCIFTCIVESSTGKYTNKRSRRRTSLFVWDLLNGFQQICKHAKISLPTCFGYVTDGKDAFQGTIFRSHLLRGLFARISGGNVKHWMHATWNCAGSNLASVHHWFLSKSLELQIASE